MNMKTQIVKNTSLKFKLLILGIVIVVLILSLLGLNYQNSVNALQQETYSALIATAELYSKQLEKELRKVDLYLINYFNERGEIITLKSNYSRTIEWNASVYRLQQKFINDASLYPVDAFFIYHPDNNLFVSGTTLNIEKLKKQIIKSICIPIIYDIPGNGNWEYLISENNGYILRVIKIEGCYLGAWVSLDRLVSDMTEENYQGNFFIQDSTGLVYGLSNTQENYPPVPNNSSGYTFFDYNNEKHMLIYKKLPFADLYLSTLISNRQIEESINKHLPTAFIVVFGISVLLMISFILIRKWVLRPVNQLTDAINNFSSGNWNSTIDETDCSLEFLEVNSAFNKMVSEIQTLKIDIYEEKLNRKNIELDFLKSQVAPHFLINCLNTIVQLTDTEHVNLAQKMNISLSKHLRYTLSSNLYVPLYLEINHVKNYIELSNIRYNDSIDCHIQMDESLENINLIPLIIYNFVENIVKYEAAVNKKILIKINLHLENIEGSNFLIISISDNGKGYSDEILPLLNNMENFIKKFSNKHIGLSNIYKRANLLLGKSEFKFTNNLTGGAHAVIKLPIKTTREDNML